MKKFALFVCALIFSSGLFVYSDEPVPSDPSNYSWHSVTLVDYKPGSEESAKQFIEKFEKASLAAGIALPVIHWFTNGKYDLVVTCKLDESPSSDQWVWSPDNDAWWKALVTQEGSVEAANKVQNDYNALVASSVTKVARTAK
jgi:hypothetical protein